MQDIANKPAVTSEDIQKELDDATKKAATNQKQLESKEDFLSKFAGEKQIDGTISRPEDEPKSYESEVSESESTKPLSEKKPSFTKTQIKLREEAEARASKAEKERAELAAKIAEMTEQLSKSRNVEETERLLSERDQALKDREEMMERFKQENSELKKTLAPVQLMQDPDFQKEYSDPIKNLGIQAMNMLDKDESLLNRLSQVASFNSLYLTATDDDAKMRNARQRDEIVSEISDNLPEFRKRRFEGLIDQMIILAEKQHNAVVNHEKTRAEIMQRRKEAAIEAQKKISEEWGGAFSSVEGEIKSSLQIPSDFVDYIKVDDQDTTDYKIAESAVRDGATGYSPREVSRVLRQGAAYKTAIAQRDAAIKLAKELQDTIAELKGGRTTGGGQATSESKSNDLQSFFSRFSGPK